MNPKRMHCRGRSPAFTLVEMLVVVTVILILMGITLGAVTGVASTSAHHVTKQTISQLYFACDTFNQEYGQYPCPEASGSHMTSLETQYHITGEDPDGDPDTDDGEYKFGILAPQAEHSETSQAPLNSISEYFSAPPDQFQMPPGETTGKCLTDGWGQPLIYIGTKANSINLPPLRHRNDINVNPSASPVVNVTAANFQDDNDKLVYETIGHRLLIFSAGENGYDLAADSTYAFPSGYYDREKWDTPKGPVYHTFK